MDGRGPAVRGRAVLGSAVALVTALGLLLAGPAAAQGAPLATAPAADCRTIPVEADAPLQADLAREHFGVDGTGVTIGIISDSFANQTSITSPDDDIRDGLLPGPGNPCGYTTAVQVLQDATSGDDEGRAMAQLVHGIAPGARILFHSAGPLDDSWTTQTAADAVTALADAGAQIIVDDISAVNELYYQQSVLSAAILRAQSHGVLYLTSAGNENAVEEGAGDNPGAPIASWQTAAYRPMSCPAWVQPADPAGGYDCLDFTPPAAGTPDPTDRITLNGGGNPLLNVQWGEAVGGVSSAFQLQLYAEQPAGDPQLVGSSEADEDGLPQGTLTLPSTPLPAGDYDVVVVRLRAAADGSLPPLWFGSVLRSSAIVQAEHDRSAGPDIVGPITYGHQSDGSATAVGAAEWNTPYTLDPASSIGPGALLFGPVDPASAQPAPPLPEPLTVPAPGFVSVECTATSFFGEAASLDGRTVYRFCGTSAAAPNAAAVFALALQLAPGTDQSRLLHLARQTALPLSNPYAFFGFADENVTGAGLLDADALLASLGVTPAPTPEPSPTADPTMSPAPSPSAAPTPAAALAATGAEGDVSALSAAALLLLLGLAALLAALRRRPRS